MRAQDAISREQRLWELVAQGDLDGFAACLLPDGLFIDGEQVQTKAELVAGLRALTLKSFQISEVRATRLTDEVDSTVYRVEETVVTGSGEVSRAVVASSTWINRAGTWLLALHHESPAA